MTQFDSRWFESNEWCSSLWVAPPISVVAIVRIIFPILNMHILVVGGIAKGRSEEITWDIEFTYRSHPIR